MYFPTNHDFMLIYTHFFQIYINPKIRYKASKGLLYHKKNDKHNLTKKSDYFHLDFEKSNLSLFRLLYHKYENLYANLQTKAFNSIIIKQIFFYILHTIFQVERILKDI